MVKPDRSEQLAKELRENLKKRKNQARARNVVSDDKAAEKPCSDGNTGRPVAREQQKQDDE